jgi:hypothetical protein
MRFKDIDEVFEVSIAGVVGRPADGAELADVNVHAVPLLELNRSVQRGRAT